MIGWFLMTVLIFSAYGDLSKTEITKTVMKQLYECFEKIYPEELRCETLFNDFMIHASSQNDPYSDRNYLHWPMYDGPDDWTAMCHSVDSLKPCLDPIFYKYPAEMVNHPEILGLYEICKYKDVLAEHSHVATCIHKHLLDDRVLKCDNILNLVLLNPYYQATHMQSWLGNKNHIVPAILDCVYIKGEWEQNCGPEVDVIMQMIVTKYTEYILKGILFLLERHPYIPSCNPCSGSSNISLYVEINKLRMNLVNASFGFPSVHLKSNRCPITSYPLSRCHMQETFKEDSLGAFCENIQQRFIPIVRPHLPLCDLQQFVDSSRRVCSLSYNEFAEIISHIPACIDDEDEVFQCYRGYNPNPMHLALLTAGHLVATRWCGKVSHAGDVHIRSRIHPVTKHCTQERYKYLTKTCTHGEQVVQMIQDLRVVLGIDLGSLSRITDKQFIKLLDDSYREKHEYIFTAGPC